MKIILATESFLPNVSGVAVATENLAKNLTKHGHEAFVFCPSRSYRTHVDPKFKDYKVIRLRSIINPFRKGYRITSTSRNEVENWINKIKPDLIHLQDPATIGKAFRDAGNNLGIPVAITNHFSLEYALSYVRFLGPFIPLARTELTKYLTNFYNKCDVVTTPTETVAKQVRAWGTKTPVTAVSNGVLFNRFQKKFPESEILKFREKYHLPNNPLILYLGRIDKDKHIDTLIKAAPEVIKQTNAHFVIAGNGDELSNIQKMVEDLGIKNDVTFLGRIDHESDDITLIYKSSTVFAIPSPIETQSIVTLEAMSCSLPVVAADANALPELVKNDLNGYLFKTDDFKTLSKYLVRIITNEKMAKKMGDYSNFLASNHEITKTFEDMLDLYLKIINKKDYKNQVS